MSLLVDLGRTRLLVLFVRRLSSWRFRFVLLLRFIVPDTVDAFSLYGVNERCNYRSITRSLRDVHHILFEKQNSGGGGAMMDGTHVNGGI